MLSVAGSTGNDLASSGGSVPSSTTTAALDAIVKFIYEVSAVTKSTSSGSALAKHFASDLKDMMNIWVKRYEEG